MALPHPAAVMAVAGLIGGGSLAAAYPLASTLAKDHGVPERATVAYGAAARSAPCPLDYRILVGIGAVESGHGTHAGSHLDENGEATGPIVSSAGATGPMQFMPGTWAQYATDGDGDGTKDPNDIDDAAAAAAKLLCASNVDENPEDAVGSYNGGANWRNYGESQSYVAQVDERVAALPADDGSGANSSAALPSDKGRICGLGEAFSPDNDCVAEAKAKAAYLWARLGHLLGEGDTPQLHDLWSTLNGATASTHPISASTQAPTASAARLVAAAEGWVGRQYAPGQTAQCAYWVRQALSEAGIKAGVSHQTLDGYGSSNEGGANSFGGDMGTIIKADAADLLKPGDIVTFKKTYGNWGDDITHVGIYAGNGQVIDRPTAEAPVRKHPMTDFQFFVGGIRLAGVT
jgi:cell wall-associated NlpC family hydrolase